MRAPSVFLRRAQDLGQPVRYGLALLITAACLGLRFLLQPLLHAEGPFATFYIGNAIAAVYLGLGPAILGAVRGRGGNRLFLHPAAEFV